MGMKLNEIKSPLRLSSKANRSIKNILKKLENTRPRILLCPFIPHLEIVRAQSWKCPLTYFSPQERFLCTNTNPPPSFKTTIKKKKKKGKTTFSARPAFNTCKGQRVPKYSRPHLSITTSTSFQRDFRIQDLDEIPLAASTKAPCCVLSVWG